MFEVLNLSDKELLDDCQVETVRGTGPGGTKSDTTETAVKLTHNPSGVSSTASDERSQHANRKIALRRLRLEYALRIRHDVDAERVTVPERLGSYLDRGLRINSSNPLFPFWVKLSLDVFEACDGQLSTTSDVFGISTNQLVNFFKRLKPLRETANNIREKHDHGPIK